MQNYLILLRKKGDYYSGEHQELYLPTTHNEIEEALVNLGCRLSVHDYEVTYAEFGFPEVNRLAYGADIFELNRLAYKLVDYLGTPGELCAELVYTNCQSIADVISHLNNRPQLHVLENVKDIYDAGEMWFKQDFLLNNRHKTTSYESFIQEQLRHGDNHQINQFVSCAMAKLRFTEYRFTPYGFVYEDGFPAPKNLGDIVLPF